MAFHSSIGWTHCTCNFWIGCTEVSRACDNCYARQLSVWRGWAKWGNHPRQQTQYWMADPLAWNRKALATGTALRVFTNSMSDFFDNQVDPRWRGMPGTSSANAGR